MEHAVRKHSTQLELEEERREKVHKEQYSAR